VETEVNGFLSYDRKKVKMDLEAIRDSHKKLFKTAEEYPQD